MREIDRHMSGRFGWRMFLQWRLSQQLFDVSELAAMLKEVCVVFRYENAEISTHTQNAEEIKNAEISAFFFQTSIHNVLYLRRICDF